MLIKKLKEEYELRYRFMRYAKMHKMCLYNMFENNNFKLLEKTLEDMKVSYELKNF